MDDSELVDQHIELKETYLFDRVLIEIATGIFALIFILASTQVITRSIPIVSGQSWTVPMSRFMLIIGTYIGSAVVTRNREHIRINILANYLEDAFPRVHKLLTGVISSLILLFLAVAMYTTVDLASSEWETDMAGGVGGITSGYLYLLISVGLLLMFLFEAVNTYSDLGVEHIIGGRKWN